MGMGLMNPKNAAPESGGPFKEGHIRVDTSAYKVHQGDAIAGQAQRQPVLALVWGITRLDEDLDPIEDAESNPVTEVLVFGLGGKSLLSAHPGGADSPNDQEIEDLGVEVKTEGPTVHLASKDFQLHAKSSCMVLMKSLEKAGVKESALDQTWAPQWVGCVFHMKTFLDNDMQMDDGKGGKRPLGYKIVNKIVKGPGEGGGKKKKGEEKTAAAAGTGAKTPVKAPGKTAELETYLGPILEFISTEKDGQVMTRKALAVLVSQRLQTAKPPIDAKLHIPILAGCVKNDDWLKENGHKYDMTFALGDDGQVVMVQFGAQDQIADETAA